MKNKRKRIYAAVVDRIADALAQWGIFPQPMPRPVPVKVRSRYRRQIPRRGAYYHDLYD